LLESIVFDEAKRKYFLFVEGWPRVEAGFQGGSHATRASGLEVDSSTAKRSTALASPSGSARAPLPAQLLEREPVKVRVRISELDAAAREALERKARLFLGRHATSIEVVEIAAARAGHAAAGHAECELVVKLREGGAIRVHEDGNHLQRALLRAAWRIDQRRELGRLRSGK
jgi:hypothetical protein